MTENVEEQQERQAMPGRLARVIATRGGLAPPEAPFVIEHREALIYMLCQAAELEHGIMCQYLFAAFSLKEDTAEGLTEEQAYLSIQRQSRQKRKTMKEIAEAIVLSEEVRSNSRSE